jgi:hypothetical protein
LRCFSISSSKEDELPSQLLSNSSGLSQASPVSEANVAPVVESSSESKLQSLVEKVKEKKQECLELQESVKNYEMQLAQVRWFSVFSNIKKMYCLLDGQNED